MSAAMMTPAHLAEISLRSRRLTFVFTVRCEGRAWLVQDSQGAMIGLSPVKDVAMQSARRAAILMSETGVRVIVLLENAIGEFDAIFTAEPLPCTRPALLS